MTILHLLFSLLLTTLYIQGSASECADPLASILVTLDCIEAEDVACSSAGYNSSSFVKLHNGVDTNTVIDSSGSFWAGAFALLDIIMDYNHQMNIGPNQASIRYVEKVIFTNGAEFGLPPSSDFPFGAEMIQHEHALVTVDDDCKMVLWDQYGDNKEQSDVDEAAMMILCAVGLSEMCSSIPPPDSPPITTKPAKKKGKKRKNGKRGKKWGYRD